MTQSKRIAVTGGIGSGKSLVCGMLKERGYPVFSCDEISHALWQEEEYRARLALLFPDCVKNGQVEKELLSARVFSDGERLKTLNAYAHGRIMERLFLQMQPHRVAFAEVPLLFEGGYRELFDEVIVVLRPQEERLKAVKARDGLSDGEIAARIARQVDYGKNSLNGCRVLHNSSSLQKLKRELDLLIKQMNLEEEP